MTDLLKGKRGSISIFLEDITVIPVLLLVMLFFFGVAMLMREQSVMSIQDKEVMLKDTESFLNILRTPVEGDASNPDNSYTIGDLIIMRYEGMEARSLEDEISKAVNALYKVDKDVCFRLYVYPEYQREILAYSDCSKVEHTPFMDAKINLPLVSSKEPLLIRLVVPGYA